ncbi:hypothetical protein [Oryzifoliimicrobium ureilyticus]|uniref:hypothetical protein n=1 Tax=Oryzifoliimicrobium ureilyticus TaxID=3113724 RepID=UPI0030764B92
MFETQILNWYVLYDPQTGRIKQISSYPFGFEPESHGDGEILKLRQPPADPFNVPSTSYVRDGLLLPLQAMEIEDAYSVGLNTLITIPLPEGTDIHFGGSWERGHDRIEFSADTADDYHFYIEPPVPYLPKGIVIHAG